MYSTVIISLIFYLQYERLWGESHLKLLNLRRNNLQRKHLSIQEKHGPVYLWQPRLELFLVKRRSPESFLFSTASVLTYGPCKADWARRAFFTSPWKQQRIINGPFSPCRLFMPAWEPSTSNRKELRVKGRAAFPPQGTIQSSSHQWLVNQKMNKKWTRKKTSQELAALMWGGQESSVQTPDSSKYISNRCEDIEERSSEDRFVDKPNLLIIPDTEQEMLRISTRLRSKCFFQLLSRDRRTDDVPESPDSIWARSY